MKTTIIDIFKEFIELSYTPSKHYSPRDIKVDSYIICRCSSSNYTIHYLYNGSSFIIPRNWGDIFSSFNVYLGDRINYVNDEKDLDKVGQVIRLMTKLFIRFDRSFKDIPGQEVLDILGELSLISTDYFRVWCKDALRIELEPLEFISIGNNVKI